MGIALKNDFLAHELFVRFLVYKIWSISCMVNFDICELMYAKDLGDFCEPDSDLNPKA